MNDFYCPGCGRQEQAADPPHCTTCATNMVPMRAITAGHALKRNTQVQVDPTPTMTRCGENPFYLPRPARR